MNFIRFGWFTDDNDRVVFSDNSGPVPVVWHRTHTKGGDCCKPDIKHDHWDDAVASFEGALMLENGLDAWLFGDLYNDKTWEVKMALWVPCPVHPHAFPIESIGGRDYDRCAFPAEIIGNIATFNRNCAGFSCPGCFHGKMGFDDPGDKDEFYDLMKHWSSLEVVIPDPVMEHEDGTFPIKISPGN